MSLRLRCETLRGLTSTTQITVTIQGANDNPTAVVDTAIAVEAGGVSNGAAGTNPTGNVLTNDTDVDSAGNGETKTVSGVALRWKCRKCVDECGSDGYGHLRINQHCRQRGLYVYRR